MTTGSVGVYDGLVSLLLLLLLPQLALAGPAPAAVPKVGSCPSGYSTSGDYCLAISDSSKHALPKTGSCPSGHSTSGDYCLSTR